MYLSRLHLHNWRSYADGVFEFNEPTSKKSVVLVGAMNGHGKTSFLVSLYLGLFGRFGLRYCEGFNLADESDISSYRLAIKKYRRNSAIPEEPTIIDVTLTPTIADSNEEEVRVVRRWFFSGKNEPKFGEGFEEVDVYVGGRLQKRGELEKDPLVQAHERIERNLFPAHAPASGRARRTHRARRLSHPAFGALRLRTRGEGRTLGRQSDCRTLRWQRTAPGRDQTIGRVHLCEFHACRNQSGLERAIAARDRQAQFECKREIASFVSAQRESLRQLTKLR